MANVLGKTRAPIKARAMMYKSVVQEVLLYVREIWEVTDTLMAVLEVFHHRMARRVMGMTTRKGDDR